MNYEISNLIKNYWEKKHNGNRVTHEATSIYGAMVINTKAVWRLAKLILIINVL